MKAIQCELCGGNELVKQDGYYVCQHCGTQYDPEEAKKLVVEFGGPVQIDHSPMIEKSLQNARRSKEKGDWDEAEKYYNRVEEYDPDNIEAIFYSSFAKAMNSFADADYFKRELAFRPLLNSISIVDDNFDMSNMDSQIELLKEMSNDLLAMTRSDFKVTTVTKNLPLVPVPITYNDREKTQALFRSLNEGFIESLFNIAQNFEDAGNAEKLIETLEIAVPHAIAIGDYRDLMLRINSLDSERHKNFVSHVKANEEQKDLTEKREKKIKEFFSHQWKRIAIAASVVVMITAAILVANAYSFENRAESYAESEFMAIARDLGLDDDFAYIEATALPESKEEISGVTYENVRISYRIQKPYFERATSIVVLVSFDKEEGFSHEWGSIEFELFELNEKMAYS